MLKSGFFPELEPERVLRLRDVAADIGRAYRASLDTSDKQQDKRRVYAFAGTYFRRAAANSLLLGEHSIASKLFGDAARCYQLVGMPYSIVMRALAGKRGHDLSWDKTSDSPQGVYALIGGLDRENRRSERLLRWRHDMDEFRGKRLGILAIPVDLYLDLFDTMAGLELDSGEQVTSLREAMLPFIEIYSSALQRAKRDKFHWTRLTMPFHPVEPDVVGLVAMVANAVVGWQLSPSALFEGLPVSREATSVLNYCISRIGRQPNNRMESDEE